MAAFNFSWYFYCTFVPTNAEPLKKALTNIAIPFLHMAGKAIERRHFNKPPVYIGGCGRSGTTLLLSVLSAHPEIFAIPRELHLFQDSRISENRVHTPYMYRLYRELIRRKIKSTATRYCEKSPVNIHHFSEIDAFHSGNFRMIQIIRDGRDVIVSKHPRNPETYWVEPERWITDVKAGLALKDHPNVLTIHYERFVENFEPTIRRICRFLEIPLSREIINWHRYATVRQNKALFSPIEELRSTSIGKWMEPDNKERVKKLTRLPDGLHLLHSLGYMD
jgi:hypothetical protein